MLTVSPAYSGVHVEANTARQLAELFACMCLLVLLLALCDACMGLRAVFQAGSAAVAGVLLGVSVPGAALAAFDALFMLRTARSLFLG